MLKPRSTASHTKNTALTPMIAPPAALAPADAPDTKRKTKQHLDKRTFIIPWSASQQKRLAFEKDLLERYFRNRVTWIDPTGNTKVEIRVTCTNNREYTLRIYIPGDYPNSCPQMVISNPAYCFRKGRGIVMDLPNDDDHTWQSKDGCTQICHYKPAEWTDDNTFYQVTMKGLIWLEAYEAHLRTGNPLSNYLQHY
ncbi:hypothetical protein ACROYT_G007379 [Oculina patagonica]